MASTLASELFPTINTRIVATAEFSLNFPAASPPQARRDSLDPHRTAFTAPRFPVSIFPLSPKTGRCLVDLLGMRRPKACAACRARRRKCEIQPGHDRCDYCELQAITCVQELPRGGWYEKRAINQGQNATYACGTNNESASPSSSIDQRFSRLPDLDIVIELVGLYFDYIHNVFHWLFHRPSFMEEVTRRAVPEPILLGILALAARFSNNPYFAGIEPRERSRIYSAEAERQFNLRDISLQTVQLGIMLGAAATVDGDTAAENLFYSVTCRLAHMLGLPDRPTSSPLEREIDIRVWWSLCLADVWSSTAVKLPRLMPSDINAPLPMDELPFLALSPIADSLVSAPAFERRSPMLTEMIKLNRILIQVNDFNQQCALHPPSPEELDEGVQALEQKLDGWMGGKPDDVADNEDNFCWFQTHGLGRDFAAVYLGYYHFGQLLYYQFLHAGNGQPEGSRARVYSNRCKSHSAQLCDMIYRAFFTPGCDVRYLMVAHVLVIASTVQIHTLLFSEDEGQITAARKRLEKNFEILLHLRPYWPVLDRIMGRLRAFHEMCRVNMTSSFVLDRWMLRFLVEFGGVMDEKPARSPIDPDTIYRLDTLIS